MFRNFYTCVAAFILAGLGGCASMPPDIDSISYSRSEISTVASRHFDANEKALKKALKPTFAKYGQPNGYVAGQMSASLHDQKDRLLGTGAFQAKFKLSKGTYWEIDGNGLAGIYSPMPAMHLVYNETDITKFKSVLTQSGVILRKDQTFTVFEQKVDEQILVTVYRTADIPVLSNMDTLKFAPVTGNGILP
jgi:hypothetical protein